MQKLIWKNSIGDEIDLTSGNYGITEWEGFANTSLNIQSQQVPFQDGGVFLDALMEQRELSVTLAINDKGNLETRYRLRRELIHSLNPKFGEGYLIYTNDFISKRIKCVAQIPLFETHNSNDSGTPKASLAWTACEPYWEDLEETIIPIKNNERTVVNNNGDIQTQLEVETKMITNVSNIVFENNNKEIKIVNNFSKDRIVLINTNSGHKEVSLFDIGYKTLKTRLNYTVTYSNERNEYLAVSDGKNVGLSTDGINWNYYLMISLGNVIKYVCYSESLHRYIIMRWSNTNYNLYIYTSTDGISWELIYTFNSLFDCVGYYSDITGVFLICASNKVYKSTNLTDWTEHQTGTMVDVIFAQNKYIGVGRGSNNSYIYYSSDAESWQSITLDITGINNIVYSEELQLFVALFQFSNSIYFYTSNNVTDWIQHFMDTSIFSKINYISFQNGYFLGVGFNRPSSEAGDIPIVIRSETGILWENLPTDLVSKEAQIQNFVYHNALFVAGGQGFVSYSYNGYQYPNVTDYAKGNSYRKIAYKKNILLLQTYNSTNGDYLYKSTDGENWEISFHNVLYSIYNLENCYIDEKKIFIIINAYYNTYKIYISIDAETWNYVYTPDRSSVINIKYSNFLNKLIGVGTKNNDSTKSLIIESEDVYNWTYIQQELTGIAIDIVSVESRRKVYIFMRDGNIYSSQNGINWSEVTVINNVNIRGVAYSDFLDLFVLVISTISQGMKIYTTKDFMSFEIVDIPYVVNNYLFLSWEQKNKRFVLDVQVLENQNYVGGYYVSYDGFSWSFTRITSETEIISNCYNEEEDCEYFLSQDNLLKEIPSNKTNIINYTDSNSDMNIGLSVGQNILLSRAETGKIITKLKYRQKYIGV